MSGPAARRSRGGRQCGAVEVPAPDAHCACRRFSASRRSRRRFSGARWRSPSWAVCSLRRCLRWCSCRSCMSRGSSALRRRKVCCGRMTASAIAVGAVHAPFRRERLCADCDRDRHRRPCAACVRPCGRRFGRGSGCGPVAENGNQRTCAFFAQDLAVRAPRKVWLIVLCLARGGVLLFLPFVTAVWQSVRSARCFRICRRRLTSRPISPSSPTCSRMKRNMRQRQRRPVSPYHAESVFSPLLAAVCSASFDFRGVFIVAVILFAAAA